MNKMTITKIKLKNYKNFKNTEIAFNPTRNIIIGENGVGKSSILTAISLVLSGSISSIEKIGFQSLFNSDSISEFMEGEKNYENLPELFIELYIDNELENFYINGMHNSDELSMNGLKMTISPNENLRMQITESLINNDIFPFEFYNLAFTTFSGRSYNSYEKYKDFIKFSFIDSTKINSNYAIKDYVSKIYHSQSDIEKRRLINNSYRNTADRFSKDLYNEHRLANSNEDYRIVLNSQGEYSFQENITVQKNGIDIKNMGQGEKVFINTDFALANTSTDISVVLIEEPENHLSHVNMHKLIDKITAACDKQTFITTHSNMIASRLDLNNAIFISDDNHANLSDLSTDTSNFFKKRADSNVLNFILSKKSILVEGDAEYILLNDFYTALYSNDMYLNNTAMISCGGKTFKRYIELAQILNKKIAIITDNDKNYEKNITNNYRDVLSENIKVFSDDDIDKYTFEVSLYKNNCDFFEERMSKTSMSNGVLSYMLNNKAEAAFRLLNILNDEQLYDKFVIPQYIRDAFEWIK